MARRRVLSVVAIAALAVTGCRSDISRSASTNVRRAAVATEDTETAALVDRVLQEARHPWMHWPVICDVAPSLKPLYDSEPDRLLWFDAERPTRALQPTLDAIRLAGDYGLDPLDYDAPALSARWTALKTGKGSAADRASFDLAVSAAVARMVRAVAIGRVDPATMDWGYDVAQKEFDIAAAVQNVRDGQPLGAELDHLQPSFPHYARARQALAVYRALAKNGEPPLVPDPPKGRSLKPGAHWEGIAQLAARLHTLGDLPDNAVMPADATAYAGPTIDAVKNFQRRHGLDPDGTIDATTIRMLNVPLAQRIRQLELAMERMRWLPDLGSRANIFVNVALFRMWATNPASKEEPLRMNVVVGKSLDHKTPIFVDEMEYVIFRPYWNPPKSILVDEILPRARHEPGYLESEDLEIVASGTDDAPVLPATPENLDGVEAGRLTLRQRPGPKNSLGLVKFLFPNTDDVYMHGTPATQLFAKARRDFSHGCIRVEDPEKLAAWVLRDQPEWTPEKIEEAMQGDKPTRVNLKQKPVVVIFYDTVHVNSENLVFFVDDIYGHDKALDAALKRGYPYLVKRLTPPRRST
jgi:murein L,D-transpeptidase YcbB/YkuD